MEKSFSRFDLFFNIMPGSIIVIFFVWYLGIPLAEFTLFSSFVFVIIAYFIGDFLQIFSTLPIVRNLFGIFIFFNKHSWLFLFKDNPIIKGKYIKDLQKRYKEKFKKDIDFDVKAEYEKYNYYGKGEIRKKTQYVFNNIYNLVRDMDMIKASNEKYLYTRSCIIAFLIITIFLFIVGDRQLGIVSIIVTSLFLYRNHRIARGFVKQVILHFNNLDLGK